MARPSRGLAKWSKQPLFPSASICTHQMPPHGLSVHLCLSARVDEATPELTSWQDFKWAASSGAVSSWALSFESSSRGHADYVSLRSGCLEHLWPCGGWESSSCARGGSEPLLPPASSCALAGASGPSHSLPLALRPALSFLFPGPPHPAPQALTLAPCLPVATCHFPLMPSRPLVSGASGSLSRVSAGLNLFSVLKLFSRLSLCPVSLSLVLCLPPPSPCPSLPTS